MPDIILKYNHFGPEYKPLNEHKHKLAPISTLIHVLEQLSPLSYRLDLLMGSRIPDVVSVIHLCKFKGATGDDIRPLPVMMDNVEEWKVEKIEGERLL